MSDEITNTDIANNKDISSYKDRANPICMKVNIRNNHLYDEKKVLLSKYDQLGDIKDTDTIFFQKIIESLFRDGLPVGVFIRNYSLVEGGGTYPRLAIRLKRIPNDFLQHIMPEEKTLMFKGYVSGNFFNVNDVTEEYNDELLPYEVECKVCRYDDPANVKDSQGGNFLYELARDAASLNKHTMQKLTEWKDYIEWRRSIVKARMHGAYYNRVRVKDNRLVFTLCFDSESDYKSEQKWLMRTELAAYDVHKYTDDNGKFSYSESNNMKDDFEPLGPLARGYWFQGHEINGKFMIDLIYDIPDADKVEEMSPDEKEGYIQNQLLSRYPEAGFLAPLVIKDLSLFKRLEGALARLERDRDCHSPNLAMWIFDITNARVPKSEDFAYWKAKVGNNWLNKNIANSQNQKEAIYKMLAAPDVSLIQGPPGTGKTTIIAEAIYQLVRQGKRVLLSSQSHDAVDNALDRLADQSIIRAVRLGERNNDKERSRYSPSKVLANYYSVLSKNGHMILDHWKQVKVDKERCQIDKRDEEQIDSDLQKLNEEKT